MTARRPDHGHDPSIYLNLRKAAFPAAAIAGPGASFLLSSSYFSTSAEAGGPRRKEMRRPFPRGSVKFLDIAPPRKHVRRTISRPCSKNSAGGFPVPRRQKSAPAPSVSSRLGKPLPMKTSEKKFHRFRPGRKNSPRPAGSPAAPQNIWETAASQKISGKTCHCLPAHPPRKHFAPAGNARPQKRLCRAAPPLRSRQWRKRLEICQKMVLAPPRTL